MFLVVSAIMPLIGSYIRWVNVKKCIRSKVYVLDTEQGALIKRIHPGKDDDHILVVSENEKYQPFNLHKSYIHAVSIVMGVIRQE